MIALTNMYLRKQPEVLIFIVHLSCKGVCSDGSYLTGQQWYSPPGQLLITRSPTLSTELFSPDREDLWISPSL